MILSRLRRLTLLLCSDPLGLYQWVHMIDVGNRFSVLSYVIIAMFVCSPSCRCCLYVMISCDYVTWFCVFSTPVCFFVSLIQYLMKDFYILLRFVVYVDFLHLFTTYTVGFFFGLIFTDQVFVCEPGHTCWKYPGWFRQTLGDALTDSSTRCKSYLFKEWLDAL